MASVRGYYLRESWHRHRVWLEDLQKQGRIAADQPLSELGMLAVAQPDSRMVTVSQKAMLRKAPRLTVGAGGNAAPAMDASTKASLLRMGPGAMPSPSSRTQRVLKHDAEASKPAARPESSQSNRSAKSARSAHRVLPPIHNGSPGNGTAFLPELTGAVVREEGESDLARRLRDQLAQRDKEIQKLKQQNALMQDINR